ncbi:MAG: hypothetical protein ACOY82_00775 [Pseudomonadota bacterium]
METPMPPAPPPVSWFWRALDGVRQWLSRWRDRLQWLAILFAVARRMRFSLLFACAACIALLTAQGQEILANSFATLGQGATFVATCLLAAISVWYTSRLLFYTWKGGTRREPAARRWEVLLVAWLPRWLGASVMLIPAIAIWPVSMRLSAGMAGIARGYSLLLLALAASFVLVLWRRRGSLRHAPERTGLDYRQLSPWTTRFFVGMLALNGIAIVVFALAPLWPLHLGIGPGVVVMLAAGLAIVVGSLLAHLSDETRLPLLGGLLLAAAVFSLWNDNHEIRLVPPTASTGQAPAPLPALDAYLEARLTPRILAREAACAGVAGCDPRVPFVVVAAEGGGVRAAAWTALVLSRIDAGVARIPQGEPFAEQLLAISGVSGGSLGGALYLASLREDGDAAWPRQRRFFETDLLTPILGNMLFVDAPQRFLPYPVGRRRIPDRGQTFERVIELAWSRAAGVAPERSAFAQPFEDLWRPPHDRLPLLLANTTVAATGERLVQAPVLLNPVVATAETLRDELARNAKRDDVEADAPAQATQTEIGAVPLDAEIARRDGAFLGAYDGNECLLPSDRDGAGVVRYSAPLSGVVHNSARFTWLSPAGRYGRRSACRGVRLVDGGYFDNAGSATADDIVWAVNRNPRFAGKVRTVVVQIRNDPIRESGFRYDCRNSPATRPDRRAARTVVMGEALDPLIALLQGREARAEQAKLALKRRVCQAPGGAGAYVEFALFEDPRANFPLHWAIADDTLQAMEAQFDAPTDTNRRALEALLRVLSPQPAASER